MRNREGRRRIAQMKAELGRGRTGASYQHIFHSGHSQPRRIDVAEQPLDAIIFKLNEDSESNSLDFDTAVGQFPIGKDVEARVRMRRRRVLTFVGVALTAAVCIPDIRYLCKLSAISQSIREARGPASSATDLRGVASSVNISNSDVKMASEHRAP